VLVVRSRDDEGPGARPDHLLDVRSITEVVVRDGDGGSRTLAPDAMRALAPDLHPLLAIRTFGRRRPDYGLDPPRFDVTITTATRRYRLLVGATNFDGTGVYVAVGDRTGLVLPRIAATLAQAEP
jgi:hypothetical protein